MTQRDPNIGVAAVDPLSPADRNVIGWLKHQFRQITWLAPVEVVMTGSSKTFVPENAARKGLIYWSPAGNSAASYSLAGGTVTLAGGIPLLAGDSPSALTGAECPVGIVTAIGTNTEKLYYVEGI